MLSGNLIYVKYIGGIMHIALKMVVGLATCVLVTSALKVACDFTVAKATQVKELALDALPKKEVPQKSLSLEEAIHRASRDYGVDSLILKVISEKESANGNMRSLYRFEPGLYSRIRGDKAFKSLSDSEVRMLASSHGVFHILGLTAEQQCQLHFSKLYNVEVAANCAAKIVRNIDEKVSEKSTSHRLREIFKRYNGAGPAAENYAADAMGRLAALLYQKANG